MSYYGGGFIGAYACGLAYTHGQWNATVVTLIAANLIGINIAFWLMQER
ncbi:Uncharacterised protein [Acinetobacter baumannii]|nr:hypothetical protein [Acinetobacter baumannii]MCQ1048595.1 hypothetical protein [Acinetobacter baumannii]MCQ1095758.1 hypothetical protein [Acinetobacter baumannii]MCW8772399.1 hypothetical protein [Acinetobacter baumannii]MCZ3104194.1 hypothetical protein [Acinetobacter baumannii]MDA3498758.1 hypothetical protein [Acinetobacter baumannii]